MPKSTSRKKSKKKNLHQKNRREPKLELLEGDLPSRTPDLWDFDMASWDTRLSFQADSEIRLTALERIERLRAEHKGRTVGELLDLLAGFDIHIDEASFVEKANETPSVRALTQNMTEPDSEYQSEIAALLSLLWDEWCPDVPRTDDLDTMISRGYVKLLDLENEADGEQVAIDEWCPAWDYVKTYASNQGIKDVDDFPNLDKYLGEPVHHLLQDLEMALGNVAATGGPKGKEAASKRLDFVREVCAHFPASSADYLFNMRRAQGESLFMLDLIEDGDACYEQLVEDYPHDAWSYIGWGDEYSPAFWKDRGLVDIPRARSIYERGLQKATSDRDAIEDRLKMLAEYSE